MLSATRTRSARPVRSTRALGALALSLVAVMPASAAPAPGTPVTYRSVQAGSWSDTATWDSGQLPALGIGTVVEHSVTVQAPGATAQFVAVQSPDPTAVFTVTTGGVLSVPELNVAPQMPGRVEIVGGSVSADSLNISFNHEALVTLSGGTVSTQTTRVGGAFGSPGTLEVAGPGASFDAVETFVHSGGRLVFRPDGSGPAGLPTFTTGDLNFDEGAVVEIAPDYPFQPGDSWDLFQISGNLDGFANLEFVTPTSPFFAFVLGFDGSVLSARILSVSPQPGDACEIAIPLDMAGERVGISLESFSPQFTTPGCNSPAPAAADMYFRLVNTTDIPRSGRVFLDESLGGDESFELYEACNFNLLDCVSADEALSVTVPPGVARIVRLVDPTPGPVAPRLFFSPWSDLGGGSPGAAGQPTLEVTGKMMAPGGPLIEVKNAPPNALTAGWLSLAPTPTPAFGGTLHAFPYTVQLLRFADAAGDYTLSVVPWPAGIDPEIDVWLQWLVQDPSVPDGITLTNGLRTATF